MATLAETIVRLKSNIAGLPAKDVAFATGLVQQYEKKGQLSDKQAYWALKLADRAEGIPDFEALMNEPKAVNVGGLSSVLSMFETVSKKLKYPAIVLATASGIPIRITQAGATSSNAGSLYIKIQDTGVYVGKVSKDGDFKPAKSQLSDAQNEEIGRILRTFAADPAGTAARYGKLHGKCCFCNTALTDDKSTAVGYGPTCAKHYNLPWGKVA